MLIKAFAGLVGLILAVGFLAIPAWKLREVALIVVILIGIAMMVYELYEQVSGKEDDPK